SVTVVQGSNVPHEPSPSGAEARSTTPPAASTPEPESVPSSTVTATDAPVYHGPPVSDADCPLGAVESAVIVSESPAVRPVPFVAVTVVEPSESGPAVQA